VYGDWLLVHAPAEARCLDRLGNGCGRRLEDGSEAARLRALGVDNRMRDRFRYFSREGFAVGDGGAADAFLREHLEDPSSSGQAMMGARQWAGQADAHMTLTVESDLIEEDSDRDGHRTLRRIFNWRPAEKDRDGRANRPQGVCVASEKDSDGRLLSMSVVNEGDIEEATSETDALAQQIGGLVQRGAAEISTGEIAAGVGRDPQDIMFKRALTAAADRQLVVKLRRGVWAAGTTEAGLSV
jgi:hypothetical protein